MYCPRSGHTDISKCRFGHEIDYCNKQRCYQGPDDECDEFLFGKHCAGGLRCSCGFCQGCIGGVCHSRTCGMQIKRVPSKIHSIAEFLRQQEQQQRQLQLQQQQLQLEQEEQRQLQDLLQQQSERHALPLSIPLPNEFNNVKSVILDRLTPYPFNNSSELIFNN